VDSHTERMDSHASQGRAEAEVAPLRDHGGGASDLPRPPVGPPEGRPVLRRVRPEDAGITPATVYTYDILRIMCALHLCANMFVAAVHITWLTYANDVHII